MTSLKDKFLIFGKFYGKISLLSMGVIFNVNIVSSFGGYFPTNIPTASIDIDAFLFITTFKSVCYGLLWPLIPYQVYKDPNLLLTTRSITETDNSGRAIKFTIINIKNK